MSDALNAAHELLEQLRDPDARRTLGLRLRLERLHARANETERQAFPDAYGGGEWTVPSSATVDSDEDPAAPKGPASLLDSLGISVRGDDAALTLDLATDPYLREIEWYSREHRHAKAVRHAARMVQASRGACEQLSEGGLPVSLVRHDFESRWRWHKGRAKGSLERFSRVEACGTERVSSFCVGCGVAHDAPARCGTNRVCLACRNAARKKRHARFGAAQGRVLSHAERVGLLRRNQRGGRWSEKLVTLTVPHVGEGEDDAVHERIRLLFTAWRSFSRELKAWAKRRDSTGALAWYRAFEWTPGADGLGHPHFHLWVFSPYLPRAVVAGWWTRALLDAGLSEDELPLQVLEHAGAGDQAGQLCAGRSEPDQPVVQRVRARCARLSGAKRRHRANRCGLGRWAIVDVRGSDAGVGAELTKGTMRVLGEDGRAIQRYIEGWSLLDVTHTGEKVPAVVIARVYEALDGRRLVSTSRRLLDREREGCASCGGVRTVRVEVFDPVLRAAASRSPYRQRAHPPPTAPPD